MTPSMSLEMQSVLTGITIGCTLINVFIMATVTVKIWWKR